MKTRFYLRSNSSTFNQHHILRQRWQFSKLAEIMHSASAKIADDLILVVKAMS